MKKSDLLRSFPKRRWANLSRPTWAKIFGAFASIIFATQAHASGAGQIIREARCKLLIRGPLDVSVGDILEVTRRPKGQGASLGQAKVLRVTETRISASVVGAQGDCRKFTQAHVFKLDGSSMRSGRSSARSGSSKKPSLMKMLVAIGPGLSNTNLKGVSRDVVLEDYPLILTALNIKAEIYPLAFSAPSKSPLNWIGVEGIYRLIAASSDVEVTTPSVSGTGENKLAVGVKRSELRGGAIVRIPIWAGRFFGDLRGGFYSSSFTSVVNKFEAAPESSDTPLEISPLRDLRLSGLYVLGGAQFQPVNAFRTRIGAGIVLAPKYTIDNRIKDAPKTTAPIDATVETPSAFLFDVNLGYAFKNLQLGLELSLESFRGAALFPDGSSKGSISETHFMYGFNAGFLL